MKTLSEENEHFMIFTYYDKQKACKSKVRFINTKSEKTTMFLACDNSSWPKYYTSVPWEASWIPFNAVNRIFKKDIQKNTVFFLEYQTEMFDKTNTFQTEVFLSHTALLLNTDVNQKFIKESSEFNIWIILKS